MLSAGRCEKEIKPRVALTYGWLVFKRFGKAMKLMSPPNTASFMHVYSVYFYMRLGHGHCQRKKYKDLRHFQCNITDIFLE